MDLKEAKKVQRTFRLILLAVVVTLTSGTVVFHYIEKWSYLDSFYFSAVSLATVGYGDLTPTTNVGKMVTVAYLFIGIGIIALFINNLVKGATARRVLKGKAKYNNKLGL